MKDVSFDGMAEPGSDLGAAWRERLRREGKLSTSGGTIRDLVLGLRHRVRTEAWMDRPETVAELTQLLRDGGYLADRGLATALFVVAVAGPPDPASRARSASARPRWPRRSPPCFGRRLIRLQCYEGIDTNQALYEWDYARQMLQIRALSERQLDDDAAVDKLFGPKFLLERPLLEAVRAGDQAVLLIDEIDRADDEFEAFLLELLVRLPDHHPRDRHDQGRARRRWSS